MHFSFHIIPIRPFKEVNFTWLLGSSNRFDIHFRYRDAMVRYGRQCFCTGGFGWSDCADEVVCIIKSVGWFDDLFLYYGSMGVDTQVLRGCPASSSLVGWSRQHVRWCLFSSVMRVVSEVGPASPHPSLLHSSMLKYEVVFGIGCWVSLIQAHILFQATPLLSLTSVRASPWWTQRLLPMLLVLSFRMAY